MEKIKSPMILKCSECPTDFTAKMVKPSEYLEGHFHSMLTYFRGINRPPDQILVLKLKELLIHIKEDRVEINLPGLLL
ncbi:hypothetical protein K5G00_01485 [Maribellus maritimus]|nr:hypothetical protein [Maribellus maritimus]MCG6186042.1 hypothetical protein [Maribellus maritimus]